LLVNPFFPLSFLAPLDEFSFVSMGEVKDEAPFSFFEESVPRLTALGVAALSLEAPEFLLVILSCSIKSFRVMTFTRNFLLVQSSGLAGFLRDLRIYLYIFFFVRS
jgi:hypothetical protein